MFQSLWLLSDSHVGFSLLSMSFDLVIAIAHSEASMCEGPAPTSSSPQFATPLDSWGTLLGLGVLFARMPQLQSWIVVCDKKGTCMSTIYDTMVASAGGTCWDLAAP
jgi:hypothetical protein